MRSDFHLAVAGVALALGATAATAQVTAPAWRAVPTQAEVDAAYPGGFARGLDGGDALLSCQVGPNGSMRECSVVGESQQNRGFGAAALNLAEKFYVDPATTGTVGIPIHFTNPGRAPAKRVIVLEDWTAKPDPARTDSLYPIAARDAKIATGVGKVECRVGPSGEMTACVVQSEAPAALGFGDAALAAAPGLRAALWTHEGEPTIGAYVDLPLRFNAPAALGLAENNSLRPAPPAPPAHPGDITVKARRLVNNHCADHDMRCWGEVAKEIWTDYPQQMDKICGGWEWTAEVRYQNLQDILAGGSPITSTAAASTVTDELPAPEHFLCNYPHAKVEKIKGKGKPAPAAQPSGR